MAMIFADESLGERVRRTRIEKGWTQKDLAKMARVSIAFISRLENNDPREFSYVKVARVLKALSIEDINPDDLLPPKQSEEEVTEKLVSLPIEVKKRVLAYAMKLLLTRNFEWADDPTAVAVPA